MISALKKNPDGTLELTITIPVKRVKQAYDQALASLVKKSEIKGFRKGKAPKKVVEEKIGKNKIYEDVLQLLLPQVYLEAVKEQKIKPIIAPKVRAVSLEEGKDWQVVATTCELPEIKLGDYQGAVKKALAAEKIWVPGKDKEKTKKSPPDQDQQLQKVFKALLDSVKFTLPSPLIDEEVNKMLSRLVDQTGRLGLTVEQYLQSTGKTQEEIRREYQKQAEESLKLELILSKIADQKKVEIKEEDVEKMIKATPDEKTQKALSAPAQKVYLRQLLRKRTVIDSLLKL
jgi:FKBP-type peptidyl-prolyl cis-trans isomerase (trigger factor)